MKLNRITMMLLLSIAAFAVLMACSISGVPLVSQAEPTATRRTTRVARATFTPRPAATDTDVPSPTEEPTKAPPTDVPPTDEPEATKAPTRRPVTVAPTNPPAPVATEPPPPPTTSPYRYAYISNSCEHSGGVHIFVVVYSNYKDPNSKLAGARVVASYAPDSPAFGDTVGETNYDGVFDYVMSPDSAPPWTGTVYAWVVDKDNNRISELGGPVELNGKHEDAADTCWIAKFFFAGGK